jgi:hypothetical protein
LAAWRDGHRVGLRNRRPGFESRFREIIAMLMCIIGLICIVCTCVYLWNKGIGHKLKKTTLKCVNYYNQMHALRMHIPTVQNIAMCPGGAV